MSHEEDLPGRLGELLRIGTVTTVDLAAGRCVVDYGDGRTGPIRWSTGRAGGTRIWSPPSAGEQVLLFCPDTEIAGAVVLGAIPSNANPPAGNTARELIQFADGTVIAFDPEAHLFEISIANGGSARIVAEGSVSIIGDVSIEGSVDVTGDVSAEGDVKAGQVSLTDHKHPGVQRGGGLTDPPQ